MFSDSLPAFIVPSPGDFSMEELLFDLLFFHSFSVKNIFSFLAPALSFRILF